jgi:hypothetical protein
MIFLQDVYNYRKKDANATLQGWLTARTEPLAVRDDLQYVHSRRRKLINPSSTPLGLCHPRCKPLPTWNDRLAALQPQRLV